MKKISYVLCLMLLFLTVFSFISFGANAPLTIEKAYKTISQNNGKDAFIIGNFSMIHTKNRDIVPDDIREACQDIGNSCSYYVRMQLTNTEKNTQYLFDMKPITGSTAYRDAKKLEQNAKDPYWVLQVPPGNYEISNFIIKVNINMQGYHTFSEEMLNVPVSKIINRQINFNAAANQIVYIGDFDTVLETYICLAGDNRIYWPRRVNINLNNNFETVKTNFLNGADDKSKDKISAYDFVSAL